MSKINPKKAYASEVFDGFGGIGIQNTLGGKGTLTMQNFRILPDGSIRKRCGWEAESYFDSTLRGHWSGELNGVSYRFVVAGSQVYRLIDGEQYHACSLSTDTGSVCFFTYCNNLYLLDGHTIRRFDPLKARFVAASGYVPLFGKNWNPETCGVMNEPLNLLNNRIRLHYQNLNGSLEFTLPFYVSSVDQVRLDTELTDEFIVFTTDDGFSVNRVAKSVEVCCTIMLDNENKARLNEAPFALSHNDGMRERLMLYGSEKNSLFFCAATVDEDSIGFSKAAYPDSDPLYFTSTGILPLGDSEHPITSVCSHGERFLAFHKDGAYSVSIAESGRNAEAYPLLHGMGCRAKNAIVRLDGDPVVINSNGVFTLHAPDSDPDDFTATALSDGISELSDREFADRAFTVEDRGHGELWFGAPNSPIYVFNTARRAWYTFNGINATNFFTHGDRVGACMYEYLSIFDESKTSDNGAPIVGIFKTGYLAFDHPEVSKRSLRLSLCADPGARAVVEVKSESGSAQTLLISERGGGIPVVWDRRLSIGRFRLLQVTVSDSLGVNSRYYRLALHANV